MKKRIVLLLVIVLILLAIPATVFLVNQRQELRKRAAPATTLTLAPATVTKKVGDTFSLEVRIDTAENQVLAAELYLVFDPEKLEAQSITNGALFPNILSSGVVDRGTASITVGANSNASPVTGVGTAAVIRLKTLAPTAVPISVRFASNTFVGALGEASSNVLIGTTPTTITITGAENGSNTTQTTTQTTPTPSPSPTPLAGGNTSATSSSTLNIISPSQNTQTDEIPTLQGKATPGSTVTITIYSNPITVTVTADANGNWIYTPTTPLASGPHNVVVSSGTQTATTSFVVAGAGGAQSSTDSATPIAGDTTTTVLLLIFGGSIFVSGFIHLRIARRRS